MTRAFNVFEPSVAVRQKTRHAPLRTQKEMAEELGLSLVVMGKMMARPGAPKPRPLGGSTKYFTPQEVRAWVAHCKENP